MCHLTGKGRSPISSVSISLISLTSLIHLSFSVDVDSYNSVEVKLVEFPLSLESLSLRGLALSYSEE